MKSLVVICIILTSNLFAQGSIIGTWLTQKKDAKMQIYENNNKYFGKIVWLRNPLDKNNKVQTDNKNPDEKLRDRKIEGLNILSDFVYGGDNEWTDGKIYDPENGKTYSCNMKLVENHLEIRGYVLVPLFGRTEVWERVQ